MIPFATIFSIKRSKAAPGNENSLNPKTIKWEKLNINNNSGYKWEVVDDENIFFDRVRETRDTKEVVENKVQSFHSLNRSIIFGDNKSGPDISFLVPLGFKSAEQYKLDFSIRGWNRRPPNSNLFAWNGGDAVAQINYPIFNEKNYSFWV